MENKSESLLVVPLGTAYLAGFSHLGVVDRWLATPKRARIVHWLLSRDRSIDMQQNTKKKKKNTRCASSLHSLFQYC